MRYLTAALALTVLTTLPGSEPPEPGTPAATAKHASHTAYRPHPTAHRTPAPSRSLVRPKPPQTRARQRPTPALLPRTASWSAGRWSRFPARVERAAYCIAHHESWSSGLWTAQNAHSSASGFAQWVDGTWAAQSSRAGLGASYAHARLAPPPVQAAVFAYQLLRGGGLYPWPSGPLCSHA